MTVRSIARVLGQQREHVVEESDAGGDLGLADAVEQQFQFDLGFGRLAMNFGSTRHGCTNQIVFSCQLSVFSLPCRQFSGLGWSYLSYQRG